MGITDNFADYEYATYLIRFKVKRLIGLFGYTESDREDLEQDLMLHLLQNWSRFDPQRGAAKTFINRVLENKISHIVEHRKAQKRGPQWNAASLDERLGGSEDRAVHRLEMVDQEEYLLRTGLKHRPDSELSDLRVELSRVLNTLPDDLRQLCQRLRTQTVTEISQETGVSRQKLYESIHKLREVFASAGLDEYL